MGIETGSRLGPYEIIGPLGAGGMGEVYRAKDTRLGRDVAIKALPDEFSRDPERLARFEREARLLASLQHANIAGIHGLEVVEDHRYLVLEFVEGETLAARVRRGAIPVDETIDIARAIAAALEAAHESGIVHRDLKPGNVMLTRAGEVKVLDFGLAKGGEGAGSASKPGFVRVTHAHPRGNRGRSDPRDRRLHESGAGARQGRGPAHGHLVVRLPDVRVPDRAAGLRGRDRIRHRREDPAEPSPRGARCPAGTPERLRGLLRRCLEKDVEAPPARHRRCAHRAGGPAGPARVAAGGASDFGVPRSGDRQAVGRGFLGRRGGRGQHLVRGGEMARAAPPRNRCDSRSTGRSITSSCPTPRRRRSRPMAGRWR